MYDDSARVEWAHSGEGVDHFEITIDSMYGSNTVAVDASDPMKHSFTMLQDNTRYTGTIVAVVKSDDGQTVKSDPVSFEFETEEEEEEEEEEEQDTGPREPVDPRIDVPEPWDEGPVYDACKDHNICK